MSETIEEFVTANKARLNSRLEEILKQDEEIVLKEILDAAKYMVLDAGHRWRPLLTLVVYETLKRDDCQDEQVPDDILNAACAVELLHSASLIYDDIMDKSELRRGKPTCHIRYGESIALLAEDQLETSGYYLVNKVNSDARSLVEMALLSVKAMRNGEGLDVLGKVDESTLLNTHRLKSAIYAFAGEVAGVISATDNSTLTSIRNYCENIGIAYLIEDDILDIESTQEESGKPLGQDKKLGKFTAVDAYSIDGAKRKMQEYLGLAKQAVADIPNNQLLIAFVDYMFGTKVK